MSLILDALKKSEAERQRQTGPTLLEVRISQPRRRYPVWMLALGALLAVNIVLLLYFVVRRPTAAPPQEAAAVSGAAAATGAAPPVTGTATPATLPASVPAMTAATAATLATVPSAAMASAPSATPVGVAPMAAPGPQVAYPAALAGGDADGVATPYALGDAPVVGRNPADDEPAVSAGDSNRYANLPSFADVGGDLPALRLDLHVFAERPRDRYALINMHRVREGDLLPEGARVLAITRDGVALAWRNQEFMLRPQ